MSIKTMTRVWEHSKCKGSKLLLLLAIADFADDDGFAWPGVDTLAKKIRMSRRQAQRIVNELSTSGELYVRDRGDIGRSHHYLITVGFSKDHTKALIEKRLGGVENIRNGKSELGGGDNLSGVTPVSRGVDIAVSEGVDIAMSPEPSLSVNEPSSSGANAPPQPSTAEKSPKEPTGKNAVVAELVTHFCELAQLPEPQTDTAKKAKEFGAIWKNPLLAIAKVCEGDTQRTKNLITWAVRKMDADNLTMHSPASIEKVAIAEQGRRLRLAAPSPTQSGFDPQVATFAAMREGKDAKRIFEHAPA